MAVNNYVRLGALITFAFRSAPSCVFNCTRAPIIKSLSIKSDFIPRISSRESLISDFILRTGRPLTFHDYPWLCSYVGPKKKKNPAVNYFQIRQFTDISQKFFNRLWFCRNKIHKRISFSRTIKVRNNLQMISSTHVWVSRSTITLKSRTRGNDVDGNFSDEKLILFGGPGTSFDLIALLHACRPRYNLPRTRPRVATDLIDGAASVHSPSLLSSLPQSANILDTSLAGTYYNGCLGFPGARARWPRLLHAARRVDTSAPLFRPRNRDGMGIAVVSRREGERMPAVRKLLEVSGNWR